MMRKTHTHAKKGVSLMNGLVMFVANCQFHQMFLLFHCIGLLRTIHRRSNNFSRWPSVLIDNTSPDKTDNNNKQKNTKDAAPVVAEQQRKNETKQKTGKKT